jgi:hypothetical protein
MRSSLTQLRTRLMRPRWLAVVSGTTALTVGVVLTLISPAQARNEPAYLQPAPSTQQLQAWSGNSDGQTLSPASYAAVLCLGSTAYISVRLIRTNLPRTTFQPVYGLDSGPLVWTGVFFTTDWIGNGSISFTLDGLAAGNHEVKLDINNTPSPGSTYYVNETYNHNGGVGIYFACPS